LCRVYTGTNFMLTSYTLRAIFRKAPSLQRPVQLSAACPWDRHAAAGAARVNRNLERDLAMNRREFLTEVLEVEPLRVFPRAAESDAAHRRSRGERADLGQRAPSADRGHRAPCPAGDDIKERRGYQWVQFASV